MSADDSLPKWWQSGQDRPKQNKRSREQERKRAKETGGKVQKGSGSSWRARGDVRTDDDLEQLKYTDKASYSLKVAEWRQIAMDAASQGREPSLIIEFSEFNLRLKIVAED